MKRYNIYCQEYIRVSNEYNEETNDVIYLYRMGEPIYIGYIDRNELYSICRKRCWHHEFVDYVEIVGKYIQTTIYKKANFILIDMNNNVLDYYEIVQKEDKKYNNYFDKIGTRRPKPCYKFCHNLQRHKYKRMLIDNDELKSYELDYNINLNHLAPKNKNYDFWYDKYIKRNSRCWKDQSKRKRQYKVRGGCI